MPRRRPPQPRSPKLQPRNIAKLSMQERTQEIRRQRRRVLAAKEELVRMREQRDAAVAERDVLASLVFLADEIVFASQAAAGWGKRLDAAIKAYVVERRAHLRAALLSSTSPPPPAPDAPAAAPAPRDDAAGA